MIDRHAIKQEAKAINRTAAVNPIGFTLLFYVVLLALVALRSYFDSASVAETISKYPLMYDLPEFMQDLCDWLLHFLGSLPEFPAVIITFVSLVTVFLSMLINAGYAIYILGIRRGEKMPCSSLFEGFAYAGKVILLFLLMEIFIILWSFLFVIPGIIAGYRYSFALYNLIENPELSAMEAIRLSKQQTSGYKWKLFVLDLSFIGWYLLSGLTCGILMIWLTPWMEQAKVGYFRAIKGEKHIGYFPPEENDGQFKPWDER